MTYAEKLEFLDEHVRMPGTSIEGEDLMRLISLISHLTMLYRKKHKETGKDPLKVTPMTIIVNACGKADMQTAEDIYESISLHCDLLLSHDAKFDTYGATSVKDMMAEIKRTIDMWLPF